MVNVPRDWQGTLIGRYRLVRLLGRGGMGEVWLADDSQLRRQVALKLLPVALSSERAFLQDFEREARAIAALEHPNILQVHDFGEQQLDAGLVVAYLVLPYITGGSLRERLRAANGPLAPGEAITYLRQAALAIDYAHSKQMLHRDIKPANMLLQQNWLFLADFGIAKLLSSPTLAGRTHRGAGTPEYMAPEQARGLAGPASDRYSLAVTAYQLLTGQLPFRGDPLSVLRGQIEEEPPRPRLFNPAMPLIMEQALLWGMAKRPEDRPTSCAMLVDAIAGTWRQNARTDGEGTILAPWSKRPVEQFPTQRSISPDMAYQLDRGLAGQDMISPVTPAPPLSPAPAPAYPGAYQPTAMPIMPPPSAITASAYTPDATTYRSNAPGANEMTTPPTTQVPPAQAAQEGKLSRRALLIGAGGAAIVAAGGGAALFAYLQSRSGVVSSHPIVHASPTPIPGPRKLIKGVPLLSLTGHRQAVYYVAWDPTGRYLVTGGEDERVMLWDIGKMLPGLSSLQALSTPARVWTLPQQVLPNGTGLSSDGKTLAAVVLDPNIYLINTTSNAAPQAYTNQSQNNNALPPTYDLVAWSPTASLLAAHQSPLGGPAAMRVEFWQQGHTTGPLRTLSYTDTTLSGTDASAAAISILSWSIDGKMLAGHTNYGKVIIWDAASGKVFQVFTLADRPQFKGVVISNECQAWSPLEPHILASSDLDLIYIWDVAQARQLLTLQLNEPLLNGDIHPPYAWGMSWSPNGRYLALSYPRTPRIYIWDIQTLRHTASPQQPVSQQIMFPDHAVTNGATIAIAWSPDGRYIAAGYGDSTVIVWKVDGA
jgi:serine/threonine protein kinase/WD40 repeat protein